jgi:hypothetical protein
MSSTGKQFAFELAWPGFELAWPGFELAWPGQLKRRSDFPILGDFPISAV